MHSASRSHGSHHADIKRRRRVRATGTSAAFHLSFVAFIVASNFALCLPGRPADCSDACMNRLSLRLLGDLLEGIRTVSSPRRQLLPTTSDRTIQLAQRLLELTLKRFLAP